jgi:hypothetical protein
VEEKLSSWLETCHGPRTDLLAGSALHSTCAYAQNLKLRLDWHQADAGDLATERGLRLGTEDRLRRELLQELYCYGVIDKRRLENRFGIVFDSPPNPGTGTTRVRGACARRVAGGRSRSVPFRPRVRVVYGTRWPAGIGPGNDDRTVQRKFNGLLGSTQAA